MTMTITDPDNRPGAGFRFRPLDSPGLARAAYPRDWLVEGVLVRGQPAVLGGPKKALKTSLAVDLAVSLGTGVPFLGHFPVPRRVRAAILSGESGEATLQETARRVCVAKRVSLDGCDSLWQFDLPRLSVPGDRARLADGLRDRGVGVVVIDPLYLCLLAGGGAVSPANLYEVGPLLRDVAAACLATGATPVLVHHTVKRAGASRVERDEPLGLDDLAYSGIGEFSRQWLLVSRRRPYRASSGEHELVMAVGGSAGHSGCWRVDVNEGSSAADLTGRRWDVRVSPGEGDTPRRGRGRTSDFPML